MKPDIHTQAELELAAPALAAINKAMPYAVPAQYFSTLSTDVLANIAAESLSKTAHPFTVPTGYFDTISTNILAIIAKEKQQQDVIDNELKTIAPLLTTINKQPNYSLPANYFETLQVNTSGAKHKAKIIAFSSIKRNIGYVAAACVIGFITISTFIFSNKSDKIDYAAYKQMDVNKTINKISNEELLNYLDNVNSLINTNPLTTIEVKVSEIQDHIQAIPDEELKQYLKEVDVPSSEESQLGI